MEKAILQSVVQLQPLFFQSGRLERGSLSEVLKEMVGAGRPEVKEQCSLTSQERCHINGDW
jgi:hypothetical protein